MIRVYEAIKQGRRQMIIIPGLIIGIGLSMMLIGVLNDYFEDPMIAFILGVILSLGVSFTYKYYFFSKWLVWAYENVHDVHLLDARAKSNGLLDSTNYYYKKTRIKVRGEDEITTIGELLNREKNPEILLDKDLPSVLRVSTGIHDDWFVIAAVVGLVLSILSKNIFLLILVVFILLIWELIRDNLKEKNPEAILTVSAEGVILKETNVPWGNIKKWAVVDHKKGSYVNTYLELKTSLKGRKKREIRFDISELNISRRELEYCMDVYYSKYQILHQKS